MKSILTATLIILIFLATNMVATAQDAEKKHKKKEIGRAHV